MRTILLSIGWFIGSGAYGPLRIEQIDVSPVSCPGTGGVIGNFHVTALGGTPPYTYHVPGYDTNETGDFSIVSGDQFALEVQDSAGKTTSLEISNDGSVFTFYRIKLTHPSSVTSQDGAITITTEGKDDSRPFFMITRPTYLGPRPVGYFGGLLQGTYYIGWADDNASCNPPINESASVTLVATPLEIVRVHTGTFKVKEGHRGRVEFEVAGGKPPYIACVENDEFEGTCKVIDGTGIIQGIPAGNSTLTVRDAYTVVTKQIHIK
jgi:hypothetical protein